MSNKAIVEAFLGSYKNHDAEGMLRCLDEAVGFSDYAFDIRGKEVRAMWRWFCIPFGNRREPIEVLDFGVSEPVSDIVNAWYQVHYLNGRKRRPVEYVIESEFRIRNGKIATQKDRFGNISEPEFLKMAFGFPESLKAFMPLFHTIIRIIAWLKLKWFMATWKGKPA